MLHTDHLLHKSVDLGVFGLLALFCLPLCNHPVSGKCYALKTCEKKSDFFLALKSVYGGGGFPALELYISFDLRVFIKE